MCPLINQRVTVGRYIPLSLTCINLSGTIEGLDPTTPKGNGYESLHTTVHLAHKVDM